MGILDLPFEEQLEMAKNAAAKKKPARPAAKAEAAENENPIVSHWKKNSQAKADDVAKHFKVSTATANKYKKDAGLVKARKGKGKKRGPKAGKKAAVHTSNGHGSLIETAAAFVSAAGGLTAAKQVLEQLSIIGQG